MLERLRLLLLFVYISEVSHRVIIIHLLIIRHCLPTLWAFILVNKVLLLNLLS